MTIEIGLIDNLTDTQYAQFPALSTHYYRNHTLPSLKKIQIPMKMRFFVLPVR
jgi:hypothetical protein